MTTAIPEDDFAELADAPLERAGRGASARIIRAPQRAEPVREANRTADTRLQRSRKRTEDPFFVDTRIIPPGISYEWKAESSYGKENREHMANCHDNHWRAVPEDRHPGLVTRKDGQVLMERPAYLTQDARQEDYDIALGQVRGIQGKLGETPDGQLSRAHPSARNASRLNVDHSLSIPED